MLACTIIARNYLAQARILAETFAAHTPGGKVVVLLLDPDGPEDMHGEPFEVLVPDDILDPVEFGQMATMYTVVELATAVKPWLLEHLLERSGAVTYFDPDIAVFSDPSFIDTLARDQGLVLTPHALDPLPRGDSLTPGEDVILKAGIFNLGFVAVGGERGLEVVRWWQSRLRRECVNAPEQGRFVDQRWMDLAPAYFSPAILRHPGCNVAWWNLPTREVQQEEDRWTVNGEHLVFFHFSGFSPSHPHLVSRHQGSSPRVLLSQHPDLARLFAWYCAEMLGHGHAQESRAPYGLNGVGDLVLDTPMRQLFREALLEGESGVAAVPPNPFSDGPRAFIDWLSEPAPGLAEGRTTSRYLQRIRDTFPGLHDAFPMVPGNDTDAFEDHVRKTLIPDGVVPQQLEPPSQNVAAINAPSQGLRPGVNVIGYFTAESGVGQAARLITGGLEAANIPHATINYDAVPGRADHPFVEDGVAAAVFDTNLICVNADMILAANHWMGEALRDSRYRIGLWWWETSVFPHQFDPSFAVVDEVWAGSEFVANAIRARTNKPVHVIPLPVPVPDVRPNARRIAGVTDDAFFVLFSYDFNSVFMRKNPLGAVAAYKRAFTAGDGCVLLLKSVNGEQHLEELEELRMATADRPDIILLDEYMDAELNHGLIAECDCYLSLHRSEGFGLTIAEAMALGRPVVATAYSANLEFMSEETGYLVPATQVPIPPDAGPYPAGTTWAEPDIEAAARVLAEIRENPGEAAAKGEAARRQITRTRSPEATGAAIGRRLATLRVSGANKRPSDKTARIRRRLASAASVARAGLSRRGSQRQAAAMTQNGGNAVQPADLDARLARVESAVGELTDFAGRFALDVGGMLTTAAANDVLVGSQVPDTNRLARYSALAILEARASSRRRTDKVANGDLARYELRCFSQNGEDGVLDEILWRIGINSGAFVEFGVESGLEGNCVLLAEKGWQGLFMEADVVHAAALRKRFRGHPLVQTIESTVTPGNVNDLIASAGLAGAVDVLSIDIDGNDYWVWQAIDVISPAVVCIEYNAHVPPGKALVQPLDTDLAWNGSQYFGASLAALEGLGRSKGYTLVHTDLAGVNAFFVRAQDAESVGPSGEVIRRSPNFYLQGQEHPEDPLGRTMSEPPAEES